jgi:hypothetical protein
VDNPSNGGAAYLANGHRLLMDPMPNLEAVAVGDALVFVNGHGKTSEYKE